MFDNKLASRLHTSILNKQLQGQSKIPVYNTTSFVTSGVNTHTLEYNTLLSIREKTINYHGV